MVPNSQRKINGIDLTHPYLAMDTSNPKAPFTNDNSVVTGDIKEDGKASLQLGVVPSDDLASIIGQPTDNMPRHFGGKQISTLDSGTVSPRIVVREPDNNAANLQQANNIKQMATYKPSEQLENAISKASSIFSSGLSSMMNTMPSMIEKARRQNAINTFRNSTGEDIPLYNKIAQLYRPLTSDLAMSSMSGKTIEDEIARLSSQQNVFQMGLNARESSEANKIARNTFLANQNETRAQNIMNPFGLDLKGETSTNMLRNTTLGIAQDLQRFGGKIISDQQENIFQYGSDKIDQTSRGYILDRDTGSRQATARQQLENRLLVDKNARDYYARNNNISASDMDKWASQRWDENVKQFGNQWIVEQAQLSGEIYDPGRYSQEDIKNIDTKQVTFQSLMNYGTQTQENKRQIQENNRRQLAQWMHSEQTRKRLAQLDVRYRDSSFDPAKQGELLADFETQRASDTMLLQRMAQNEADRPAREAAKRIEAENNAKIAAGEKLEASILGTPLIDRGSPFTSGTQFQYLDTRQATPQAIQQKQTEDYSAAIKNLENLGIAAGMGLERDDNRQYANQGPVDETKPGWVFENGSWRQTKSQVQMDIISASDDTKGLSSLALAGRAMARKRAENTRKQMEIEQLEYQNNSGQQLANREDQASAWEDQAIRRRREQSEDESAYYLARGGRMKARQANFRLDNNNNYGDDGNNNTGGGDDEYDYGDIDVIQQNIIRPKEIPSTKQASISSLSSSENPEASLISGTAYRPPSTIPEVELAKSGTDTIITSSGEIISGSSVTEMIQNQQGNNVASHIKDYINQKILDNNEFISSSMANEMNNIATSVSMSNLNKAVEGL